MRKGPKAPLRRLFGLLRPHRRVLVVVGLLTFVTSALALAQPALVRVVLERLGDGESVAGIVLLLVVLALVEAAISAVTQFQLRKTALGVVLEARKGLAGHLLRLPIPAFDLRRTGDMISRVGTDTSLLQTSVTGGFIQALSSAVVGAGAVVAMALVDTQLLLVTVAVVAVSFVTTIGASRRVRRLTTIAQTRLGEMTAGVERALSGVRTIRANRAEGRETRRVGEQATAAHDAGLAAARLESWIAPVASLAAQGAFLMVLGLGGARVARGELGVGDLIAFVLYLFLLVRPLAGLLSAYVQVQSGLAALHRMDEVTDIPVEGHDDATTAPAPVPDAPRLSFDEVSFHYLASPQATDHDGDDAVAHRVLTGVTFDVAAGGRVALVGPSGAGKSSLLSLVIRFRDPESGTIRLDGVDIRDMPRDAVRGRVGYVEQEAPVLAGTLRENLLLADEHADDAAMYEVLAAVRLDALVARRPEGLDVQVGERGLRLSGGERQRLAMARVLLAAPDVLLLDEPTSNLDAANEEALKRAIDAVATGRTLLVVAHRLSTVADSDMIVVLDDGRVRATGTHEELIASDDLYRDLATTQLLV